MCVPHGLHLIFVFFKQYQHMPETEKVLEITLVPPVENPLSVLENLRRLRSLRADAGEFWTRFLSNVSVLCRAPLAVLCEKEMTGWRVRQEYCTAEKIGNRGDGILRESIFLVERACRDGYAYGPPGFPLPPMQEPVLLATGIDAAAGEKKTVLLLVLEKGTPRQLNDIILRTQLIRDIPLSYRRTGAENPSNQLLSHTLEIIDTVVHKKRFLLSALTLINEIANRFDCGQVSLGWKKGRYLRTVAISRIEKFDRHSEAVHHLEGLFEESCEQDATVAWPETENGYQVNGMHQKYSNRNGLSQVVTIPICLDETIIAAATLEKHTGALTALEIDSVTLALHQVAHWLNALYQNDRWIGGRLALAARQRLDSLLGVEHSLFKAAAILLTAVLAYSVICTRPYHIEGTAVLKTDSVSYISAPFDGVVHSVLVHEGASVARGDLLLTLDDKEMRLKEVETAAGIAGHRREADKHRAIGELADMRIAQSHADAAEAELEKIRYYLSLARLTAQSDGIVVEGDQQELTGSPVSRGDILLKIARVESMYAHIKISESDIGKPLENAKGRLKLISRPGKEFPISVETLIPMAQVDPREGNVFLVNARIDAPPQPWWRPGMSGMARIDAGEERIIWIWMHRAVDFIRMTFWW